MNEEIKAALDCMHDCASESFFACERFGEGSPQHMLQMALFSTAEKHYEALCSFAGMRAYATYDGDQEI